MSFLQTLQKYRLYVLGAVIVVLIAGAGFATYHYYHPHSAQTGVVSTQFKSGNFSFEYPTLYKAQEYDDGVVSLGGVVGKGAFIPLIDIDRYRSDPDKALPGSFEAFVAQQVQSFCGSDSAGETISCTNPVTTAYTTAGGLAGKQVMLTLVRKDAKTGVATTLSYGPIYVFDTTAPATADDPLRYEGVFVYPTFSSFILLGTTSPAFIQSIADTIQVKK